MSRIAMLSPGRERLTYASDFTTCGLPAPAYDADIDGDDYDRARDDPLPRLRNRQNTKAVHQHAHHKRADDGSEDRAFPAGQRRAADDDRRNRVQFIALTERRLSGIQTRGHQHAAQS